MFTWWRLLDAIHVMHFEFSCCCNEVLCFYLGAAEPWTPCKTSDMLSKVRFHEVSLFGFVYPNVLIWQQRGRKRPGASLGINLYSDWEWCPLNKQMQSIRGKVFLSHVAVCRFDSSSFPHSGGTVKTGKVFLLKLYSWCENGQISLW